MKKLEVFLIIKKLHCSLTFSSSQLYMLNKINKPFTSRGFHASEKVDGKHDASLHLMSRSEGEGEGAAAHRRFVACTRTRDKSQFEYRHTQMLLGIKTFQFSNLKIPGCFLIAGLAVSEAARKFALSA